MVPTHDRSPGSVASVPVLRALTSGRTYRHLVLLGLLFPVGIANIVILVTGISLGVGLTPLLVGIPMLAGVLVAVTWLAVADAELLSSLTDHEVACEGFSFGPAGFWAGLTDVATRRRPSVLVLAFGLSFPLGILSLTVFVTLVALSAAFILAPVLAPLPVASYQLGPDWVLNSPLELTAVSLLGLLLFVSTLWLADVAGEVLASGAAVVLGLDASAASGPPEPGAGAADDPSQER